MSQAQWKRIAPDVRLGNNVTVYDFVNLYGCEIGDETSIGTFVEVQKGARIGRNCKISTHSFICEGVTIEDNVFIGHHVVFVNDKYPSAVTKDGHKKTDADWKVIPTLIRRDVSVGSGAVILCGITVGEGAMIGAGSVVVRDVEPHTIVAGNPARMIRQMEG